MGISTSRHFFNRWIEGLGKAKIFLRSGDLHTLLYARIVFKTRTISHKEYM